MKKLRSSLLLYIRVTYFEKVRYIDCRIRAPEGTRAAVKGASLHVYAARLLSCSLSRSKVKDLSDLHLKAT